MIPTLNHKFQFTTFSVFMKRFLPIKNTLSFAFCELIITHLVLSDVYENIHSKIHIAEISRENVDATYKKSSKTFEESLLEYSRTISQLHTFSMLDKIY